MPLKLLNIYVGYRTPVLALFSRSLLRSRGRTDALKLRSVNVFFHGPRRSPWGENLSKIY